MSGAIPGFGIIFDILYITPFLLPILIGFFAERTFKTKLFGRLADIAIGLVGGIGLFAIAAGFTSNYNNAVARKFSPISMRAA